MEIIKLSYLGNILKKSKKLLAKIKTMVYINNKLKRLSKGTIFKQAF